MCLNLQCLLLHQDFMSKREKLKLDFEYTFNVFPKQSSRLQTVMYAGVWYIPPMGLLTPMVSMGDIPVI